jgi:hypothetical protein
MLAGSEDVDVVADGVVGQWPRGPDGELIAEEDIVPSLDEPFVDLGGPVEGDVPEPLVERAAPRRPSRGLSG